MNSLYELFLLPVAVSETSFISSRNEVYSYKENNKMEQSNLKILRRYLYFISLTNVFNRGKGQNSVILLHTQKISLRNKAKHMYKLLTDIERKLIYKELSLHSYYEIKEKRNGLNWYRHYIHICEDQRACCDTQTWKNLDGRWR